jgi:hypothetical protein
MQLAEAIQQLQTDPETFLNTEYLVVAGGGLQHRSTDTICKMEQRDGPGGGWRVTVGQQDNPRVLQANEFRAWYVPMQQLPGMTANHLPKASQSPIALMITSQITDCMFALGRNGQDTVVAHIQPDATAHLNVPSTPVGNGLYDMRGEVRQSDMRMRVRMQGMDTVAARNRTYGADGTYETVAVVGLRGANDHWTIYTQNSDRKTRAITGCERF